jgi:hypothetical protein
MKLVMIKDNCLKSRVDVIHNNKVIFGNIWILNKSLIQKWNGDNSRNTGLEL